MTIVGRNCGLPLLVVSFFLVAYGMPQPKERTPARPGLQTDRLTLDGRHYLPAPAHLAAEDLVLELEQGAGFVALTEQRPTALVLVGSFSCSPGRRPSPPPSRPRSFGCTRRCSIPASDQADYARRRHLWIFSVVRK
jgi:hypothetical protein